MRRKLKRKDSKVNNSSESNSCVIAFNWLSTTVEWCNISFQFTSFGSTLVASKIDHVPLERRRKRCVLWCEFLDGRLRNRVKDYVEPTWIKKRIKVSGEVFGFGTSVHDRYSRYLSTNNRIFNLNEPILTILAAASGEFSTRLSRPRREPSKSSPLLGWLCAIRVYARNFRVILWNTPWAQCFVIRWGTVKQIPKRRNTADQWKTV